MEPESPTSSEKQSFWTTAPGIVTALTGLITAITAFLTLFHHTDQKADGSPTPTANPPATVFSPTPTPMNFITVISIKNGNNPAGQYFYFDPADMDAALKNKVWEGTIWASQTSEGPRRQIHTSRNCSGGATNACGRYEPIGKAGDFFVGERLYVFWGPG